MSHKIPAYTRRRFPQTAAGAGAVLMTPQIIPAAALDKDGAVAPSEKIVMGAIGIGGRGSGDLEALLGQSDVRLVAVCDVKKGSRERAKHRVDRRYGIKDRAAYRDFRDLLAERADTDALLIATGDRWHAPASVLAMKAGNDIYCEKPGALTIAAEIAAMVTDRGGASIHCGRV
jgi:hypothetical protein